MEVRQKFVFPIWRLMPFNTSHPGILYLLWIKFWNYFYSSRTKGLLSENGFPSKFEL